MILLKETVLKRIFILSLVLLAGCAPAVTGVTAPWKTSLFNQERSNATEEEVTLPLKRRSVHRLWPYTGLFSPRGATTLTVSPVVDENTVYLGNGGTEFTAIEIGKGSERWHYTTRGHTDAAATVDGDNLYFGTGEGVLYALQRESGEKVWSFNGTAEFLSSPLVVGKTLYAASADNRLLAFDKETGKVLWRYSRGGVTAIGPRITASPASEGGRIYHLFSDGHLLSFDGATGKVLWKRSLFTPSLAGLRVGRKTPLITKAGIFIADGKGAVLLLDKKSGEQLSRFSHVNSVDFVARGDTVYLLGSEDMAAVEIESGKVVWRRELSSGEPLSIFGAGSRLFLLSNRLHTPFGLRLFARTVGRIEVVETGDGSRTLVDEIDSTVSPNAVFSQRTLFVVADEGYLVTYSHNR